MKPYLYCLMEVGAREFLARCLTSCVAAERGFTVLLGHQYTLLEHSTVFPQGLYFSKGTNAISTTNMKLAKDNGHINVACEEENFFRVLTDNPLMCSDENLPGVCDAFIAMGREEREFMDARFGDTLRIYQAGNARTDILRPELRPVYDSEVAALREQYGDYILVNSNSGIINSSAENSSLEGIFNSWSDAEIFDPALSGEQRNGVFQDFICFEEGNALAIRGILTQLAQTNFKVIFRPHPGERRETWDRFLAELNASNIVSIPSGSHIPLILGAKVVVHTACTTGVEALLLDVPALSLRTTKATANEYYLSNRFNVTCDQVGDAMDEINSIMSGDNSLVEARAELMGGMSGYLDCLEGTALAAEKIVDVFKNITATQSPRAVDATKPRQQEPAIIAESENYKTNPLINQKFGVGPELVAKTVSDFQTVLGRFKDINVEQMSETVWKFSR